jgi:hypothetical protein
MSAYYRIKDKGLIGRQDGRLGCYLFRPGVGWVPDDHILTDRLIGYDEFDHEIGNTDMLFRVEEISEEQALAEIAATEK